MSQDPNSSNENAIVLLNEVFNLWTNISTDENGDEVRIPGSEEELIKSQNIITKVSAMDITDAEVTDYLKQIIGVLDDYEETLNYQKSPNGQANKLLDDIYYIWSTISVESDIEYHKPSNDGEVEESWELIKKIETLEFDDEEITERLKLYKEVLESFSADSEVNDDYQLAWEKLSEVYNTWSEVSDEDGQEFRSPKNRREIRISRRLLHNVKKLNVPEQDVIDRIEELESVVDTIDAGIPKLMWRVFLSVFFSAMIIIGFFYQPIMHKNQLPEFEYDQEWFTTTKDGYIAYKCFVTDEMMPNIKQKVYVKKGTVLKPLGKMGRSWFQVETPSGQRGFIEYTLLGGARFVEADEDAVVFNTIGSEKKESIAPGTAAKVLEREIRKQRHTDYIYLKLKLEDGRIMWANDYDFKSRIFKIPPTLNQTYGFRTTIGKADSNLIGQPLENLEDRYGVATSVLKIKGNTQAYFRHLIIVDSALHHKGILVNLDKDGIATDIEYTDEGKTRFYDNIPLVKETWNLDFIKINSSSLYDDTNNKGSFQWWDDFTDMNWFTMIIGWIVGLIIIIVGMFLLFSIPRAVVAPIMQLFAFTRLLGNGMVKFINFFIYLAVTYVFFIYMILYMGQWLIPAIVSLIVFIIWWRKYSSNISYNRCPSCHTIYSALNEGSTYTGRSTSVTRGTWEKDLGTKVETSGNKRYITRQKEIRDKKTTTHVDNYLDHRMCARCGYMWDVDRDETEESTVHY